MGNYLSISDVQDRMEQTVATLYDDHGELNTAWIEADIGAVEGMMNAYISTRYRTPLASPADAGLLRGMALNLFVGQAFRRSPGAQLPAPIERAEQWAIDMLVGIAAGRMQLGGDRQPESNSGRSGSLFIAGNPPCMTRAQLRGF